MAKILPVKVSKRLPLTGLFYMHFSFYTDGFRILEENISLKSEYSEIVIEAPSQFSIRAGFRDDENKHYSREFEVSNTGNIFTIKYKNIPGRTLRLFKADSEDKTWLIGTLRL